MRSLRFAALVAGGLMVAACAGGTGGHAASGRAVGTRSVATLDSAVMPGAGTPSTSRLPDDGALHWVPAGRPFTKSVGHDIRLNECAVVAGARSWRQQAYAGAGGLPAEQDVFTFAGTGAAHAAFASIVRGMAACQATTRTLQARSHVRIDAVVARVAQGAGSAAWTRDWTGVAGISAPGPQVNHLYVTQHGDLLSDMMFTQIAPVPERQPMAARAGSAASGVTAGGPITRAEVLQRAQSWVSEHVPYNQGGYWTDGNGTYREDCSGYVSMAWALTSSMVTWTLPSVSTEIPWTSLQPGDIFDYTAEHTFLFAGWTDSSGDFSYYAESNPSDPTHGPTPANIYDATLEGWPTSDYGTYRYDNIATSSPSAPAGSPSVAAQPNGDLNVAWMAPDGSVWIEYWAASDGTWYGPVQLAGPGSAVSDPAVAAQPDGNLNVAWEGANGTLEFTYLVASGNTWYGPATLAGAGNVAGVPSLTAQPDGNLNIAYRGDDGSVQLKYWAASDGTWYGPSQLAGGGSAASDPAVAAQPDGDLNVAWEGTNGTLEFRYWAAGNGAWYGPVALAGAGNVAGVPSLTAQPDGNLDIAYRGDDGSLHLEYWANTDNTWYGPSQLAGRNSAASDPTVAAQPNGNLDVVWEGASGTLEFRYWIASDGAWYGPATLVAAGNVAAFPSASAQPDGNLNIAYRGDDGSLHLEYWADTDNTWYGPSQLAGTSGN